MSLALAVGVLLGLAGEARAFTIDTNQNLTGSAPVLLGVGAGNAITGRPVAGGHQFDWGDANGDGSRIDPVATPGLQAGPWKLYRQDYSNLVLNLDGGSITGDSGGVTLSTAVSGTANNQPTAGSLTVTNVGSISCGGIQSCRQNNSSSSPGGANGSITIGRADARAGSVRADFIWAAYAPDFNYTRDTDGGDITIWSSGDVKCQTSAGVAGDIATWNFSYRNGQITIHHDGAFRCDTVRARAGTLQTSSCGSRRVMLNGDILGNGASGACEILGDVLNEQTRVTTYGTSNEGVIISNYTPCRSAAPS